jgi:hypothetical protein
MRNLVLWLFVGSFMDFMGALSPGNLIKVMLTNLTQYLGAQQHWTPLYYNRMGSAENANR